MPGKPRVVIVGGGLAGHAASAALRAAGFDGRIVLIGDEPEPPYDRTPLSKGYLRGQKPPDELPFASPARYAELDIELLLGRRATALDLEHGRVGLDGGDGVEFDKLLLATGAEPARLDLPGFDLPGVHYLRTLADARALRADLERAGRVLVIGAGLIGCEVAASARLLGRDVVLVDLLPAPMAAAIGPQLGEIYARIHRAHGVDQRMERRVVALRGSERSERVEEALFAGGERVACDLVVVGVGVRPRVDLVAGTAVAVDDGIVVDRYCQSSVPGIFAAGDMARWPHPLAGHIRVEHYDNAALQGAAAGRAMAGQPEPYAPVPYFWSDQYDVNLQAVGLLTGAGEIVLRGDPDQPSLTAFMLRQGRVRGAVTINRPRDLRPARRLVEADAPVDPARLADPDTDLRELSREFARL